MTPTVRIVAPITDDNPLGFVIINESDKQESDKLFEDKATDKETKQAVKPAWEK